MKTFFIKVTVFLLIINIISSIYSVAQPTDSWVVDNQQYYKIKVATNGVMRLYSDDLARAGIPVSLFAPQNVQIFSRGEEIPIYISGAATIDYIEFIGQKNDGWLDKDLYIEPSAQTNPYYSLVNDTSAYFFTWNQNFSGNKRYENINYTGNEQTPTISSAIRTEVNIEQLNFFIPTAVDPEFHPFKGWFTSPAFTLASPNQNRRLMLDGLLQSGEVKCTTIVVGLSEARAPDGFSNHHFIIYHGSNELVEKYMTNFETELCYFNLQASAITSSVDILYRCIPIIGLEADRMAIAFLRADYPAKFHFSGNNEIIYKITSSNQSRKIALTGLSQTQQPLIYEPHKGWKIIPTFSESEWVMTIPASETEIELHVNLAATNLSSTEIERAPMQLNVPPVNYFVITHSKLMSAAQQYAAYRGGTAVDIDVLYNRFAYGIKFHPLAIRYFLQAHIKKGNPKPEYLFLIGKGIDIVEHRKNPALLIQNLVPTAGNPPSDMLLTTRLTSNSYIPEIATGRLAALNTQQIIDYMNKTKEHEQRQPSLGAKNILHFGGGSTESEKKQFKSYLDKYAKIISAPLFGGYVSTFVKNTSAPIATTQSDSIKKIIENGASILTFFGHSYVGGFDYNIDEPSAFNNQGKYPFFLTNSCYTGNIFQSATSQSLNEKWIFISGRGALGFLASTHWGYPVYLDRFTNQLYHNISSHNYGESFGKSIFKTVNDILNGNNDIIYDKSTCLEFVLHGDPAIKPVTWALPDMMIDENSIIIEPANITTAIDSFAVRIIVSNLGQTLSEPFGITIERNMPSGLKQTNQIILPQLYYKDTVEVYFNVDSNNGTGHNTLTVILDEDGEIEELSKINNIQTVSFTVFSTDIFPIYPFPNSMTSNDTVRLKASTGNAFAPSTSYIFQLDTKSDFSSVNSESKTIESTGGVLEWNPDTKIQPETPYFWRTARYSPEIKSFEWNTSAFIRTDNQEGWKQNSVEQFRQNSLRFMEYIDDNNMRYVETIRRLTCYNIGMATGNRINDIKYDLDGNGDYGSCGATASMVAVVIDSLTLLPWLSDRGIYGHIDFPKCPTRERPNNYFTFRSNTTGLNNLSNFLNNTVTNGCYVLVFSVSTGNFNIWTDDNYIAFELLGASMIRTVPSNYPYIFFGKKGFPELAEERIGDEATSNITLMTDIKSNFHHGSMITGWIGPAQEWKNLKWEPDLQQIQPLDSVIVKIFARSSYSTDSLVAIAGLDNFDYNLSFLNNQNINSIKLEYFTLDTVYKTPVPPRLLQVEYTPYPELAINPLQYSLFHSENLDEGDSLVFGVAITNVSHIGASSFDLKYTFKSEDNTIKEEKTVTIDTLAPFSYCTDTVHFGTFEKRGNFQIQIEANYLNGKSKNFQEMVTFNNVGWRTLNIKPDKRQPILNVTFDGRYIMNNEIISSHPEIVLKLSDLNQFIMLNDTSVFEIYLTSPGKEVAERVWISNELAVQKMIWYPQSGNKNDCKIIWKPEFDIDGIYRLRVRAKNMSHNTAGKEDYVINFQIINHSTITNLINYPNPFTTSTRFVFTITGSQLPDELRIQIFTVTGRLVREISMEELGNLRIGQNLTSFAWDGTDQFGDKLANGVYFYRIIAKIDGKNIEHFDTAADKFFKKDFGKMYLMR